jgi:hypothetical protein
MDESELYAAGEAWEMRLATGGIAGGAEPRSRTSRLGRLASGLRVAFELLGSDVMIYPFLDC